MFTIAPPLRAAGPGRDPYRAYLKLLMHADGADGGTTFTDDSPSARTLTAAGATTSKTLVKFGTTSALADSAGDNITIASNSDLLFDGIFTLSFWLYFSSLPASPRFFMGDTASSSRYMNLSETGLLTITAGGTASCGTLSPGVWNHVEVGQSASSTYTFLNGALQTNTGSVSLSESGPANRGIFMATTIGASISLLGHIDELAWYKGACIHTASFAVPNGPTPNF